MTAPHIPAAIWFVVADYGPKVGIGSGDFFSDKELAASAYEENMYDGFPCRVLEVCLDAGTSRDCTDECELLALPWRDVRAAE